LVYKFFVLNFFLKNLIMFFEGEHKFHYPWAKKGHDWLDFLHNWFNFFNKCFCRWVQSLLAHGPKKLWLVEFLTYFFLYFKILNKLKVGAKFISPCAKETMFGCICFMFYSIIDGGLLIEMKKMEKQ
jgi:hypothetical protein